VESGIRHFQAVIIMCKGGHTMRTEQRQYWSFSAAVSAVFAPASYAAIFTVNSTADTAGLQANCISGIGDCTLRSAVQAANLSVGVDDTINLPAGTITLISVGAVEDAAATGDLDIGVNVPSTLTIVGAGAGLTIIDGNNTDRVFETIAVGTSLTISGVTIRNGNSLALAGGCILAGGATTLVLNDAVVTGCTAANGGGGIDNSGSLTMNVVAATNNTAQGINNGAAGTIIWTDGELSGATDRGINNSGQMTLTNVTISGNTTAGNGGGIDNGGTVTLQNVTISNNTSTTLLNIGGLRNDGTASLRNTIISGNLPANCGESSGTNVIGKQHRER
jgi:CSLREA domain-containing protein